ncbi:MAG: ribonuclease R [Pseudomonadota bacterium]
MSQVPTKAEIKTFLQENPGRTAKRDIARAFGLKGAGRIELKRLLKELEEEGDIVRGRKRAYRGAGELPPVAVLRVIGTDEFGDLRAVPIEWDGDDARPKLLVQERKKDSALGQGDRVLARIEKDAGERIAKVIRKIGSGPRKVLGIFRLSGEAARIVPVDKKADLEFVVAPGDRAGARDGELVEGEQIGPKSRMGLPRARIVERLGDPSAPRSVSLVAIHEHGIPDAFPDATVKEALRAKPVTLGSREDLRHLPLITIDPADARDHDDAVCALPDPETEGGFLVWVAIADVAHYVRPGAALDLEARKRGNSTYFPDRVVPMLPEQLSGDLCSLHEGVERACLAVEMRFAPDGQKISHRFVRGLMKSPAALTYEQAQAAADGRPDDQTAPHVETIKTLWQAYACALKGRQARAPLNLDLPERQIVLSESGEVVSVAFKDRFDAHKLIEEFMVQANVCAAETLERKHRPFLYRVHQEPERERLDALREVVGSIGLSLPKGQVLRTKDLNRLLDQAAGTADAELLNLSVLRSMMQAFYSDENFGHFGLNLAKYAHFTSPIRRYVDLIVHRALIAAHHWGDDGLRAEDVDLLEDTAEHISQTERRSMLAERDTTDRYLAAYLSERVGHDFPGRISGIARFGIFVKLDETGADGLVPISRLGLEFFHYDADARTLTGDRSGRQISLGQTVRVRLEEAVPITGGLLFDILEIEDKPLGSSKGARKPVRGKGRPKNTGRLRQNKRRTKH